MDTLRNIPWRIQIVEDERIVAEDLSHTLEGLGYSVTSINSTGEDAVVSAQKFQPDLIFMDIHLAGKMTGIEAAQIIRKDLDIPIIYVTAYADSTLLAKAKITEPYGYILKPFDERELHMTLEIALYKHAIDRRLKESEEKYRSFVQNFLGIAFRQNPDFSPLFLHGTVENLTGYTEADFKNGTVKWFDLIHQDDTGMVRDTSWKIQNSPGMSMEREYRIVRKDGKVRWVYELLQHVPVDATKPAYIQGTIYDITEIMVEKNANLMRELASTNSELRDFAYVVSHDLKAPLRAIGSLTQWLYEDYKEKFDDGGKEQLDLIINRVNRMQNLIEGILQYSRVGRTHENLVLVDSEKLVRDVIDSLAPPENITVTIKTPLPKFYFEKTRLEQVFSNLIGNAIKYMDKEKGEVDISCRKTDAFWEFSVADNGPGIEEKYYEKIFQIFQTLHPRDEMENTGIGLSIVKKIVDQYGGRVWVESEVGKGSTFRFTVPLSLETKSS